jgi:hypothetical protein
VVSVDDTNNTITTTGVLADNETIPAQTWTILGLSSGSFAMTSLSMSEIAEASDVNGPQSLTAYVIVVSPQAPAVGTPLTLTPSSAFTAVACFAQGTRIATARGEVAVENLAEGDLVPTQMAGRLAPVRWVGRRTVDVARHPRPWDVAPVRVQAGAFGAGQPTRDLILSPDHAVRVGDLLIPIRYLLNGATVAQEFAPRATYFHVELDTHDLVLAEGLACESFLDTGNRRAFVNSGGPIAMVPEFARDVWAERGCLPLVLQGPAVIAEKRRLLARAAALGWRTTQRPDFSVAADGRPVAVQPCGAAWRALLPAGTSTVRLVSRAAVPAELSATATDGRRLGIAVADLLLDRAAPPQARYGRGWHGQEAGWRWTDGDATLQAAGARELTFTVAMAQTYWLPAPQSRAA